MEYAEAMSFRLLGHHSAQYLDSSITVITMVILPALEGPSHAPQRAVLLALCDQMRHVLRYLRSVAAVRDETRMVKHFPGTADNKVHLLDHKASTRTPIFMTKRDAILKGYIPCKHICCNALLRQRAWELAPADPHSPCHAVVPIP